MMEPVELSLQVLLQQVRATKTTTCPVSQADTEPLPWKALRQTHMTVGWKTISGLVLKVTLPHRGKDKLCSNSFSHTTGWCGRCWCGALSRWRSALCCVGGWCVLECLLVRWVRREGGGGWCVVCVCVWRGGVVAG